MSLLFQGRAEAGVDLAYRVVLRTTAENEVAGFDCTVGPLDILIDWGDGQQDQITTIDDPACVHTFASPGDHQVSVLGYTPSIIRNNTGAFVEVRNWGKLGLTSCASMFAYCGNLVITATDLGDFSNVTSAESMFRSAPLADPICSNWDMGSVITFRYFGRASGLSSVPIGSPTSTVDAMYLAASNFDGDFSLFDFADCGTVTNIAAGTAMSQSNVDILLERLVAGGKDGRETTINGTNCDPPSAAGYANKAILEGRGWTVTTN